MIEGDKSVYESIQIEQLRLPRSIVLLDVNGTLIPDDSIDGSIPEESLTKIQELSKKLKSKGIFVGLCSDSPLPQLIDYSNKIGIDGPIVAENGGIVHYNDRTVVLSEFPNRDTYREMLSIIGEKMGYVQEEDCIAPEFGGELLADEEKKWAFGANRVCSITLFGHSTIMSLFAGALQGSPNISIDHDAAYPNGLSIHQGNYKKMKGRTLSMLAEYGHSITMIGNSMSDWVDPSSGVECGFVGEARINEDAFEHATYLSEKPLVEGVVEILTKLNESK